MQGSGCRVQGAGFRVQNGAACRRRPCSSTSDPTSSTPLQTTAAVGWPPHPKYRGTSLIRNSRSLGPYRRPIPRVLGGSWRLGVFLSARYSCISQTIRGRGSGGSGRPLLPYPSPLTPNPSPPTPHTSTSPFTHHPSPLTPHPSPLTPDP